jgi:hypothetical protein
MEKRPSDIQKLSVVVRSITRRSQGGRATRHVGLRTDKPEGDEELFLLFRVLDK